MYEFDYSKPATLAEAAARYGDAEDPVYLSGGQTLIPTMRQRLATPTDVIDLSGIPNLRGITLGDGTVTIGALTRHGEVAGAEKVRSTLPALAALAGQIGDAQVRNCGTLGGSVANSDPAADYPAAVVALGARVHTDKRAIPGDEFFQDLFETALEPGEIITAVEFPIPRRAAYQKFPNPASRYAVVGVMVAQFDQGVRVGVTGAGPCAFRVRTFEDALNADLSPAALDGAEVPDARFNSDLHASAEYRAHLVRVMAKRAVAALVA